MAVRVVPDEPRGGRKARASGEGRVFVAGAPPSPGQVPSDVGKHLVFGEVLVWWGEKDRTTLGPFLLVFAAMISVLGFVSVLAPEFWLQSARDLIKPLAALASPLVLVAVRERFNQRAVMVTDVGVISIGRRGKVSRLAFDKVRTVRRDVLRGGVRLESLRTSVHIPPTLADDAQQAIATQTRNKAIRPDLHDPMGWWP